MPTNLLPIFIKIAGRAGLMIGGGASTGESSPIHRLRNTKREIAEPVVKR